MEQPSNFSLTDLCRPSYTQRPEQKYVCTNPTQNFVFRPTREFQILQLPQQSEKQKKLRSLIGMDPEKNTIDNTQFQMEQKKIVEQISSPFPN